jgi:hypothetical protein
MHIPGQVRLYVTLPAERTLKGSGVIRHELGYFGFKAEVEQKDFGFTDLVLIEIVSSAPTLVELQEKSRKCWT